MHLRRAVILFALVLGLTALAASVSPTRDTEEQLGRPEPAPPPAASGTRSIAFEADSADEEPPVRKARAGDHVVITVTSADGGLATVPALGRTASVADGDPAIFDVLAPAPGRYDVMFAAGSLDEPRRVGTLVVRAPKTAAAGASAVTGRGSA